MKMVNSSIVDCTAELQARHLQDARTHNSTENPLLFQGGGIFASAGSLSLFESEVLDCRAGLAGGGLYGGTCAASIVSSSFRANSAESGGGAVLREDNSYFVAKLQGGINLTDVSFEENEVRSDREEWTPRRSGSALVVQNIRQGFAQNVTFAGNRGGPVVSRWEAPHPIFLCQPGHSMP